MFRPINDDDVDECGEVIQPLGMCFLYQHLIDYYVYFKLIFTRIY